MHFPLTTKFQHLFIYVSYGPTIKIAHVINFSVSAAARDAILRNPSTGESISW
jgi:hypothetical protein